MTTSEGPPVKANAMVWPEPLYGWVVSVELVVCAAIFLSVQHDKGVKPYIGFAVVGLGMSVLCIPIIALRRRLLGAGAIFVASLTVNGVPVPNNLQALKFPQLIIPFVYVFWLFNRWRKASPPPPPRNRARNRAGTAGGGTGPKSSRPGPAARKRPTGRYTPPKAKRPTGRR